MWRLIPLCNTMGRDGCEERALDTSPGVMRYLGLALSIGISIALALTFLGYGGIEGRFSQHRRER